VCALVYALEQCKVAIGGSLGRGAATVVDVVVCYVVIC
jgi:hypothetical protein